MSLASCLFVTQSWSVSKFIYIRIKNKTITINPRVITDADESLSLIQLTVLKSHAKTNKSLNNFFFPKKKINILYILYGVFTEATKLLCDGLLSIFQALSDTCTIRPMPWFKTSSLNGEINKIMETSEQASDSYN